MILRIGPDKGQHAHRILQDEFDRNRRDKRIEARSRAERSVGKTLDDERKQGANDHSRGKGEHEAYRSDACCDRRRGAERDKHEVARV